MGYNLYVTRKAYTADDEGPEITLEEWLQYVASDSAITKDPINVGAGDFLWIGHPGKPWPLWWSGRRGDIYTKNPDPPTIRKLIEIARVLGARVLGDDDEVYSLESDVACPECGAEMREAMERIRSGTRSAETEPPYGAVVCPRCSRQIRLRVAAAIAGGLRIWSAQW